MKTSRIRKTLIMSFTLILVCLISFTMTTFAWFSDSVSSSNNIIKVGNLDAEMYWTDNLKTGNWHNIEDDEYNTVFSHQNYEPGYTEVRYIKIVNKGSLAFKYDLRLLAVGSIGELAEVVDLYTLPNAKSNISNRDLKEMNKLGTVKNNMGNTLSGVGSLLSDGEIVVAIALQMQTDAGNEYQGKSIGDGFSIQLIATQYNSESDSFGSDYDASVSFPVSVSAGVATVNNIVTQEAKMEAGLVNATVPAGVKVQDGRTVLSLSVTEMEETGSNITVTEDEIAKSLDVHIEGIADDNTVPAIITIHNVAGKYLNDGNLDLYHVENGVTNKMEQVDSLNELDKHNEFYYDAQTGSLVLALASFSEIRSVQNLKNTWKGGVDHTWYTNKPEGQEYYTIYNADQLAGLSAIVGGMNGLTEDSFAGKTVKLIADINIGDMDSENEYVFYPIGYYNNQGVYTKSNVSDVVSGLKYFKGTFDGNGHTIANFYQNTWEMFGDYNSGYAANSNHYRDGMGLFGKVKDATIKNLHINNFSCDSEFGISGVVAAYANNSTFKNIAITNCTPGVYNNANGGIVGYVGYGYSDSYLNGEGDYKDSNDTVIFENITVDNTNTIRALWGTYDGCCAGILGRYDSDSKIEMNNCHVAAKMDVFNDVCGNYQYYWYRYSAMLAGSIEVMTKDENGYIIPDLTNFYITSTTVHYGEWNDMYYCELVENSLASYTHDHQFSRLTKISSLKEIQDSNGNWIKTGDFIIVDETNKDDPSKHTCYHIRRNEDGVLYQHEHKNSGTEIISGAEVLKEDKQCIYLPFNQLFQGWGYGAKNIPLEEEYKTENIHVSSLDKIYNNGGSPIEKFKAENDYVEYNPGEKINLGDLFYAANDTENDIISKIHPESISVAITYVDENGNAKSAEADIKVDTSDWKESVITLPSDISGAAYITIQDYVYCHPTTVILHVHDYSMQYVDNVHYNKCSYENCSQSEINHAAHTYNGTTCTVCGYSYSETFNTSKNVTVVDKFAEKLFLTPNANWKIDKARFAAYFFGNGDKWVDMTDGDGDGVYEVTIPAGSWTNVIFCRMNPNASANNWNNKWNQTEDLSFSKDGNNNHYTVKEGTWDKGGGEWSTYTKTRIETQTETHAVKFNMYSYTEDYAPNKVYLKPTSLWDIDDAWFAVYAWYYDGSIKVEKWFTMTSIGNGVYEAELPENYNDIIFCRMNSSSTLPNWNNMWNQTVDLKISDRNSNLFVITTQVKSQDENNEKYNGTWQSVVENFASYNLQDRSGSESLELVLYLENNKYYSFKLNEGSTWYGNMGLIQSETTTPWVFKTEGSTPNCRFIAEQTGYYRFVYNYGKQEITVEFIGTSYSN